jgi:hypothetical protein
MTHRSPTDPKIETTPAAPETPKAMPFAIMRNSHEALRASIHQQEQMLEAGDVPAFTREWRDFQRAVTVHMAMEENSMFGLLDEVSSGAIRAAKLPAEHVEDTRLATAVDAWLTTNDVGQLRAAWDAWKRDHLHHLAHEEEVMMPLVMKTGTTPQMRARVVHERLLSPSESLPNFDWYIGWVVRKLSDHGSSGQPASVAVRVFVWGLQHACSPSQWSRLHPVVKAQCAGAIWSEIAAKFDLDGAGKVS